MLPLQVLAFVAALALQPCDSRSVSLHVHYPEDKLEVPSDGNFLSIGVNSNCVNGYDSCNEDNFYAGKKAWFSSYNNYINFNSHRVGTNHFLKTIDISSYVGRLEVQLASNPSFTATNTVPVRACKYVTYSNAFKGSTCLQVGPGWSLDINSSSPQEMSIHTYPYFNLLATGNLTTYIRNIASTALNNERDVVVYVSPSLIENTVNRSINVIVLNDGSYTNAYTFVNSGGIDALLRFGAIPADTILIGVSNPSYGYSDLETCTDQGVMTQSACQRLYELTPSVCDPAWITCGSYGSGFGGGADLYLDLIQLTIIPRVAGSLGFTVGEVSIAGFSMAGLLTTYAVVARPSFFRRGLAISPTLFWNWGEVSRQLRAGLYTGSNGAGRALVISHGSEEGSELRYKSNRTTDPSLQTWMSFVNETVDALRGSAAFGEGSLEFIMVSGGFHQNRDWLSIFQFALPLLYRPAFDAASPSRQQRISGGSLTAAFRGISDDALFYSAVAPSLAPTAASLAPTSTAASSSNSAYPPSSRSAEVATLHVCIALITALLGLPLLFFIYYYTYVLEPKMREALSDKGAVPFVDNPLHKGDPLYSSEQRRGSGTQLEL